MRAGSNRAAAGKFVNLAWPQWANFDPSVHATITRDAVESAMEWISDLFLAGDRERNELPATQALVQDMLCSDDESHESNAHSYDGMSVDAGLTALLFDESSLASAVDPQLTEPPDPDPGPPHDTGGLENYTGYFCLLVMTTIFTVVGGFVRSKYRFLVMSLIMWKNIAQLS